MFGRLIEVIIETEAEEIIISNNRITFSLQKTDKSKLNECVINIYNLQEDTIAKIKNGQTVTLKAGYKDEAGALQVFKGNITHTYTNPTPPSIITEIKIADGELVKRKKKLKLSYGKNIGIKRILADAAKKFNLPFADKIEKIQMPDIKFPNGFSFSGAVSTLMDKLTSMAGLNWTINEEVVRLFNRYQPETNVAVVLTPTSGLIGSPKRVSMKDKKLEKDEYGWQVFSFFLPTVQPHQLIEIHSKATAKQTQFTIKDVIQTGDNEEGDMQTEMVVIDAE